MEQISAAVRSANNAVLGVDVPIQLTRPEAKFGDFATNMVMQIWGRAKTDAQLSEKLAELKLTSPRELAEALADNLRHDPLFEQVEIAGPGFLNLTVSATNLHQILQDEFAAARNLNQTLPKSELEKVKSERQFGENNTGFDPQTGRVKTAVVEYPSLNMAKPYSVGHLRSGDQGWAAKNLLEATGWHVITDNHLGDYGTPFGIWMVGFEKFSSDQQLEQGGVYELGRIYIAMKAELKAEAERGEHELADQVQNWLLKLENNDPEAIKYSEKFGRISLDHMHKIMARLGISTDYEMGEKFFAPLGKQAVQKLLKQGIATQNPDGSVIVDLSDQNIKTPLLVQKSNGAALYATTDLATMLWRDANWHPDKVVYCVGAEQKFYFEQLAALAHKLGLKEELYHLWYGIIDQINEDGMREKMSSRKGVVLMEELLDTALAKARENAKSNDLSESDLKAISVGAIKFTDFSADRKTGMLFDWSKMFNLTGFSGPYIQYAAVRVNKILRDNPMKDSSTTDNDYDFTAEKSLILQLLEYPEIVATAARELEPHHIAQYVYDLARELNRYYDTTPVATAEVPPQIKQTRLELLQKISQVFTHGLGILGIEIPQKM
jgi:arginyl-tRNA synthetase